MVLPTDTLYGVGCDPFNPSAVDALFQAKQRGRDLPLPVLVHTWRQAIGLVDEVTDQAQALIAAWWPGPLTLVLREAPGIGWDLGDSRGTVAVRMPKQDFALALIQRTGPLAVSSANRSGEPTPSEIPAVVEQLGDHVGVFFDAGPAPDGPASSIVDLTGKRPRLLREGPSPPRAGACSRSPSTMPPDPRRCRAVRRAVRLHRQHLPVATAEALARRELALPGAPIQLSSAGSHALEGNPAASRSMLAASTRGPAWSGTSPAS